MSHPGCWLIGYGLFKKLWSQTARPSQGWTANRAYSGT